MQHVLAVLMSVLWLGAIVSAALAGEENMAGLERQFRELPIEARRLTGPLFWLHGDESKERLEMYVGKVAEGGNGCFTAEIAPAQRLARRGLVSRSGDLPGRREEAQPEDVDLRREVVAQPGRRRQGAAALCREAAGSRRRRRGRAARRSRPTATAASGTSPPWPAA